jgi:hypothetical protein
MRMTQYQMFELARRKIADGNLAMLEMLFGVNPITDDELRKLIAKRPATYGRFAGYLGTREGA